MDDLVSDTNEFDEVPPVVTVVDAQEVLGEYVQSTDDRLGKIDDKIENLGLMVQSESSASGTVLVDDTQWQEVVAEVQTIQETSSLALFLSLLLLCVVSAILGTRLFSVFAEGWRH